MRGRVGDFVEGGRPVISPTPRHLPPHAAKVRCRVGEAEAQFAAGPLVEGDTVETTGPSASTPTCPNQIRQMLNAPGLSASGIRLVVVTAAPTGIVPHRRLHVGEFSEYTAAMGRGSAPSRRSPMTDLGGMRATIDALREMVELTAAYPECSSD